ncbi:GFA family protein [Sphingomonas sp. GlSt437]|uniref:GFA family protein n=1 Tax=Sphingomonas sp. GlSt437 TaxID=3389970 RepID=UPI003A895425
MDKDVTSGRCLCGAFQFEIDRPIGDVRLCHCQLCRWANGSAYSAHAKVPLDRFRVVQQLSAITSFESSPGAHKHFCSVCGAPVFSKVDWDTDHIRIRLGSLSADANANITAHVWVGSKANWDHIADDLPQFDKQAL